MSYKEILEKAEKIAHERLYEENQKASMLAKRTHSVYEYYLETQNVLLSLVVSLHQDDFHEVDKNKIIGEFLEAGEK